MAPSPEALAGLQPPPAAGHGDHEGMSSETEMRPRNSEMRSSLDLSALIRSLNMRPPSASRTVSPVPGLLTVGVDPLLRTDSSTSPSPSPTPLALPPTLLHPRTPRTAREAAAAARARDSARAREEASARAREEASAREEALAREAARLRGGSPHSPAAERSSESGAERSGPSPPPGGREGLERSASPTGAAGAARRPPRAGAASARVDRRLSVSFRAGDAAAAGRPGPASGQGAASPPSSPRSVGSHASRRSEGPTSRRPPPPLSAAAPPDFAATVEFVLRDETRRELGWQGVTSPLTLAFADERLERNFARVYAANAVPRAVLAGVVGTVAALVSAAVAMSRPVQVQFEALFFLLAAGVALCGSILARTTLYYRQRVALHRAGAALVALLYVCALAAARLVSRDDLCPASFPCTLVLVVAIVRVPHAWATLLTLAYPLVLFLFGAGYLAAGTAGAVSLPTALVWALLALNGRAMEVTARRNFWLARLREQTHEQASRERTKGARILRNILPQAVLDAVREGRPLEGGVNRRYEAATVVFVAQCRPLRLQDADVSLVMRRANGIVARLEELCEEHGLEKIKTIGLTFMAVCGLPAERPDHAPRAVAFAAAAAAEGRRMDCPLRAGVSSGPLVAGVVGCRLFYDVWGDTVNTASRMCLYAQPESVLLSSATRELLPEGLPAGAAALRAALSAGREMAVKGKGVQRTYEVRLPSLDAPPSSSEPEAGPAPRRALLEPPPPAGLAQSAGPPPGWLHSPRRPGGLRRAGRSQSERRRRPAEERYEPSGEESDAPSQSPRSRMRRTISLTELAARPEGDEGGDDEAPAGEGSPLPLDISGVLRSASLRRRSSAAPLATPPPEPAASPAASPAPWGRLTAGIKLPPLRSRRSSTVSAQGSEGGPSSAVSPHVLPGPAAGPPPPALAAVPGGPRAGLGPAGENLTPSRRFLAYRRSSVSPAEGPPADGPPADTAAATGRPTLLPPPLRPGRPPGGLPPVPPSPRVREGEEGPAHAEAPPAPAALPAPSPPSSRSRSPAPPSPSRAARAPSPAGPGRRSPTPPASNRSSNGSAPASTAAATAHTAPGRPAPPRGPPLVDATACCGLRLRRRSADEGAGALDGPLAGRGVPPSPAAAGEAASEKSGASTRLSTAAPSGRSSGRRAGRERRGSLVAAGDSFRRFSLRSLPRRARLAFADPNLELEFWGRRREASLPDLRLSLLAAAFAAYTLAWPALERAADLPALPLRLAFRYGVQGGPLLAVLLLAFCAPRAFLRHVRPLLHVAALAALARLAAQLLWLDGRQHPDGDGWPTRALGPADAHLLLILLHTLPGPCVPWADLVPYSAAAAAAVGATGRSASQALYVVVVGAVCAVASWFNELKARREYETDRGLYEETAALGRECGETRRLLHLCLPPSLADGIREGLDLASAMYAVYDHVVVLCADVVGFTPLSESLSADELVRLLDELVTRLDLLAEDRGLARLKTIGDAWLAALGLDDPPTPAAVARLVAFASDVAATGAALAAETRRPIALRVGVAAGAACGAIVGNARWFWDLFGEAMDRAAEMEARSAPGRVLVCPRVHADCAGAGLAFAPVYGGAGEGARPPASLLSFTGTDTEAEGPPTAFFFLGAPGAHPPPAPHVSLVPIAFPSPPQPATPLASPPPSALLHARPGPPLP